MALLDEYENFDETQGEESAAGDPADSRRKRSELERQLVILNSDFKKIMREVEELEGQRRKFNKEEERIRVEEDALDLHLKKLQDDKRLLEEEIAGLKKKLKTLV